MKGKGMRSFYQMARAAALLVLLAACGYAGAREPDVRMVSAPVTRQVLTAAEISAVTTEETAKQIKQKRQTELALLDSVLGDPDTSSGTRSDALAQKAELAARMGKETQLEAALAYMGCGDIPVICGADTVTVFVPAETALSERERMRIVDAAVSHTGASAEDVKIILSKK